MQRSGSTRTPRVGLVLGGGGILGGAWLVGALHALAEAADWNPTSADYIVGTSAGSVVAAMTAEGVPPWFLVHHQRGGSVEGMTDKFGEPLRHADEESRRFITWSGQIPRPVLGSPQLALCSALRPWKYPPFAALTGWIGRGLPVDGRDRTPRPVVRRERMEHASEPVDRRARLQDRTARVFGQARLSARASRRSGAGVVRDPRAVPSDAHRRTAVRRRRRVVAVQPRPARARRRRTSTSSSRSTRCRRCSPGCRRRSSSASSGACGRCSGRRLGREAAQASRTRASSCCSSSPTEEDLDAMGVNLMDPTRAERRPRDVAVDVDAPAASNPTPGGHRAGSGGPHSAAG